MSIWKRVTKTFRKSPWDPIFVKLSATGIKKFEALARQWLLSRGQGGPEGLHASLFDCIPILAKPQLSIEVLGTVWTQFAGGKKDGYISKEENREMVTEYLQTLCNHFPPYAAKLFDTYKMARIQLQEKKLMVARRSEKKDSFKKQQKKNTQLFGGGSAETDDELRRLLLEGLTDESKMRMQTLKSANNVVLTNATAIADEAFRLMDQMCNDQIHKWEMLQAFDLAVHTAADLISLKTAPPATTRRLSNTQIRSSLLQTRIRRQSNNFNRSPRSTNVRHSSELKAPKSSNAARLAKGRDKPSDSPIKLRLGSSVSSTHLSLPASPSLSNSQKTWSSRSFAAADIIAAAEAIDSIDDVEEEKELKHASLFGVVASEPLPMMFSPGSLALPLSPSSKPSPRSGKHSDITDDNAINFDSCEADAEDTWRPTLATSPPTDEDLHYELEFAIDSWDSCMPSTIRIPEPKVVEQKKAKKKLKKQMNQLKQLGFV